MNGAVLLAEADALCNIQNIARCGAQSIIGFRADIPTLVELLWLVAPAEVGVQRAAGMIGGVQRAAVPDVRVEDHHRAGRREQLDLVWVRRLGIEQFVARGLAAAVGSGDHARSAIVLGKADFSRVLTASELAK